MSTIKNILKRFIPPSSKTVNGRLDKIEQMLLRRNADILYYSSYANLIQDTHKRTFLPFKEIHKEDEVIIVGTGPTLNFFQPTEEPLVYVGVNSAYKRENLHLDYLFCQDFKDGHLFDMDEIRNLSCVKFFGKHCLPPNHFVTADMPEHLIEDLGARKYFINHIYGPAGNTPMMTNLEYFPVMDCWTTAFSALQFAFYTHPKTIYLVGLDTSVRLGGHYNDSTIFVETQEARFMEAIKGYKKVKQFANCHYPDIRIVSINPVGLKGIFEDVYTKSFLNCYPEIRDTLEGEPIYF
ncbi:hypothetical protein [Aminipila sp.]|uniref:hypothetical protein n=1 Tax=Aminipila sp. TaxID=2060095 RepID=UPI00289B4F6B|nr:hypothetical protein [Aminipila sp.]